MLQEIRIKNFKKISSLNLEHIAQITLIGGRNNVGKSSVLEAITFAHSRPEDVFLRMNSYRRALSSPMTPANLWEMNFWHYSPNQHIVFDWTENGETFHLDCGKQNDTRHEDSTEVSISAQMSDKKDEVAFGEIASYPLQMDIKYRENTSTYFYNIVNGNSLNVRQHINRTWQTWIEAVKAKYLSPHFTYNTLDVVTEFGEVELRNEKKKVIEALQIIEPQIQDVSAILSNRQGRLFASIGGNEKLPLEAMGDGINRLMVIVLSILSRPKGIVLVDEMENGFHYSLHPKIWEVIAKAAQLSNTQVIATTHSRECLAGAAVGIKKVDGMETSYTYIRLDGTADGVAPKYFPAENFDYAIKEELEIR